MRLIVSEEFTEHLFHSLVAYRTSQRYLVYYLLIRMFHGMTVLTSAPTWKYGKFPEVCCFSCTLINKSASCIGMIVYRNRSKLEMFLAFFPFGQSFSTKAYIFSCLPLAMRTLSHLVESVLWAKRVEPKNELRNAIFVYAHNLTDK